MNKIFLLVIGYGNTLRGDDAVGRQVAEALAEENPADVRALSCHVLTPDLADLVAQAQNVIFVDASLGSDQEVQLSPLRPADSCEVRAHTAEPAVLLALARDLFGHLPNAWWLTIPVQNVELGEQLSAQAARGKAAALELIRAMLSNRPNLARE